MTKKSFFFLLFLFPLFLSAKPGWQKAEKTSPPLSIPPNTYSLTCDHEESGIAAWINEEQQQIEVACFGNHGFPNLTYLSNGGAIPSDGSLAIDTDARGNILVAWTEELDNRPVVFASLIASKKAEKPVPILVSEMNEDAEDVQLVVHATGYALALWRVKQTGEIKSSCYHPIKKEWTPPEILSGLWSDCPQVSMDIHGNGIALWRRFNGKYSVIESRQYNFQTKKWSFPVDSLSNKGEQAGRPNLALSPNGEGVAYWTQKGNEYPLQLSLLHPEQQMWTDPYELVDGEGTLHSPRLLLGSSGELAALWVDSSTGELQFLTQNLKVNDTPTIAPITDIPFEIQENSAQMGRDRAGNIHVVWAAGLPGEASLTYGAFLPKNGDWELPQLLHPWLGGPPCLQVAPSGKALVLRPAIDPKKGETIFQRVMYFYEQGPVVTGLEGKQVKNSFATQIDRVNVLTWDQNEVGTVATYVVFRDTTTNEIARFKATQPPEYEDHHRKKGIVTTYYVQAISPNGVGGPLASVTVDPTTQEP